MSDSSGSSTSRPRCSRPGGPLTLDELADRLEPGYPDELAARRRAVRARQGDAARAGGPDHRRSGRRPRRRAGLPHPARGLLPARPRPRRRRAGRAAPRRDRGGGRRLRPARRAPQARRRRGGGSRPGGGAPSSSRPHLGDCFDGVTRRRVLVVPLPGRGPPARALRDPPPLRPLVRRRPRPSTATRPGRSGSTASTAHPDLGAPRRVHRAARRRSHRLPVVRPAHLRRRPAGAGPGAGRRHAGVARARRRWATPRSSSSATTARSSSRSTSSTATRSAPSCSTSSTTPRCSTRPSCAPRSSTGSPRSPPTGDAP